MSDDRPELVMDYFVKRMMLLLRERQTGNFDTERFGKSAVQDQFNLDVHFKYFQFLLTNFPRIAQTHDILEDDESCALYRDLIEYRLVGHVHKRLTTNTKAHWQARSAALKLRSVGSNAPAGPGGRSAFTVERITVPFHGRSFVLDCAKLACAWTFFLNQYYFNRNGISIMPELGDHVVDGGLLYGETAVRFAAEVGPRGFVYGFDPVDLHCQMSTGNVERNSEGSAPVRIFKSGLSDADRDGTSSAIQDPMPGYRLEGGIATCSIDNLVRNGEIERVDFLKLDIEGSELAALQGAAEALQRFRPKLAISLYHRWEDYFAIPTYLDSLLPDYEFYLDHYTIHSEETVLYARPRPG